MIDTDNLDLSAPDVADVVQAVIEQYEAEEMAGDDEQKPLNVFVHPEESVERAIARTYMTPEVRAGCSLCVLHPIPKKQVDVNELVNELELQTKALKKGKTDRAESILNSQLHTLDALFHKLLNTAMGCMQRGYFEASRDYMKLALRAQIQSKMTLEATANQTIG